ncbi:MAG: alpha/beta fold hydrolase [Boseongicola sp. SB0670_bin_30]|nr:alpha/beta fold hydrolase [Boseongicola sp. SB0670_bin_30]
MRQAPPLVLIPGLMCDAGLFSALLPHLSRTRALFVADVAQDDTMSGMADRLLSQIGGEFDLLGFSMGGMVAHEVLRCAPGRVRRLALLDTNASADPPEAADWRQTCIERAQNGELMDIVSKELVPRYFDPKRPAPELEAHCIDCAEAIGAGVFVRQFAALGSRLDHHDTLRSFEGQALVLRGASDELCNMEAHLRMADALPNARYIEIEGAAHLSVLERPTAVTVALMDWLKD